MRSTILLISLAIFAGFSIESCKHSPSNPLMPIDTTTHNNGNGNGNQTTDTTHKTPRHTCSPDSVYFVNDILPLITSNCSMSGCHDGSGHSDDARALTSYSTIMSYVRASNPSSSKLYTVLNSRGEEQMPRYPIPPLSQSQDSLILAWIKQGALNNQCDGACDTTNVTFSGTVFPLIQNSCIGCHSGSSPNGSVSLTNYQQIQTQANNGKLLGSITYAYGLVGMPVSVKLSDCDINAIRIWIQHGAPNN
ncbi:MAG: hypothetical protein ACHQM6_03230 [Candidatus Kapaibacterium sp.]